MTIVAFLVSIPIRIYRIIGSPFVGMHCRFQPTCSAYAMEALRKHGAIKGTILTIRRLSKCHPWGPSGVDEVPD